MRRHMFQVSGSITVFLSFVILLVCALIGVMIEGARIHTGMQRDYLLLETAVDTEFTKYYLPLYEKYHLFFLNQGIDTDTLEGDQFLASIREYILAGMNTEGSEWEPDGIDLYGSEPGAIALKSVETAVDEKGEVFLNEVLSYMIYDVVENGCEEILEKLGLFESAQKTSEVLEKKLQTDDSMGKLDALILEMMQKVEGIILRCDGTLKAAEYFIKKFAPNGISMEAQGVSHDIVFDTMKSQYIDPVHTLSFICGQGERLMKLLDQKEQLEERIEAEKSEEEKDKEKISKLKKKLKKIKEAISDTEETIQKKKKAVTAPVDEMMLACEEALLLIPQLDEKLVQIQSEIDDYDEILAKKKDEMLPDLYQEMSQDLQEKKEYVGMTESKEVSLINQIKEMEPDIRANCRLLNQFMGYQECDFTLEQASIENFIEQTEKYREMIASYQTKTLVFDYSGLTISDKVESPLESLQDFLEEGILELILPDVSAVSETPIKNPDYLYMTYGRGDSNPSEDTKSENDEYTEADADSGKSGEEKEDAEKTGAEKTEAGERHAEETRVEETDLEEAGTEEMEFKEQLKGVDQDGYNSGITEAVGGFSLSEAGNDFVENLLLSQYIKEHFSYWGKENKENDGVVAYGVEYVIAAKDTDKKNLKSVMNRILFSRTIFNFLTLMTDAEKKAECYATAAALVGFTGLEPLVRLTQTLILIAWAYEEGVVDTAALFQGKSVSVLKSGQEFQIQYVDLLRISKSLIQSKVKSMPEKGSLLSMDYGDYLTIFLLLRSQVKKCYRSMDLIEKDMKQFQEPEFSMAGCVFGVNVEAEYSMPEKFTLFSYISDVLEKENDTGDKSYSYRFSCSHCY